MSKSITEILHDAGVEYDQKEKDNVYIDCPYCGKNNSLSINNFTGAWHCWSASCEEASKEFTDLTKKLRIRETKFEPSQAPPKNKRLTETEKKIILSSAQNKTEVIDWANSRCLDPKPLMQWGVGYWKEKRCIIIPFRDPKNGKLVGARCRADNGSQWLIGKEPALFVIDPADLKKEKTVIVEGEPDVFTLKQFGIPVVGVLGAGKVGGLNLLKQVKHPYIGFDMDDAGEEGVEKALIELGPYRCKRVHWSAKDPNDMLKSGATKLQFIECLRNAQTPEIELTSKSGESSIDLYLDAKKNRPKETLRWGYERLDSYTKGIHPGWVIFMMAEGGMGKTTFLLNILVNNVLDGVKCGIASYEEHPDLEIIPKLTAMFIERNPGGGDFDKQEIEYAKEDLQYVKIYPDDDADITKFQNWVRECYYIHGVRLIVADYLQMILQDESNQQILKRDCYKVGKDLVKEMPELTIIWAVQPKLLSKQMDKKTGDKIVAKIDGNDARGGSVIQQSCDVFLVMQPVGGQQDITQYEFTKVRGQLAVSKKDWLYKITQLEYDHSTMRQYEVKHLIVGG